VPYDKCVITDFNSERYPTQLLEFIISLRREKERRKSMSIFTPEGLFQKNLYLLISGTTAEKSFIS